MDNLDITPAFIDIFQRISKHLDLLPFQKLLNDQNSTLTEEEKQELKNKIRESSKKVRQLNLVLDELKDQILGEIKNVQADYEEKNRDLDALEEHLNYVRSNRFNQKASALAKRTTQELQNELNNNFDHNEDLFNRPDQPNSCESDLVTRKEDGCSTNNYPTESTNVYSNVSRKHNQITMSGLKPPKSIDNMPKNSVQIRKPLADQFNCPQIANNKQKTESLMRKKVPPKKEKVKNVDNIYINYPQINYISLNEFNYIPKYMKGRLSFETCNKLVDEFNKAIETKYKFMLTPNSKYSDEELLKYTIYKNQEDDETKGLFFVTPKDLQEYSDLRISMNNTKIFIQCVRHCKRIKEIRGIDRLIRYVVLNC